jgi:cell division protein FtsZ
MGFNHGGAYADDVIRTLKILVVGCGGAGCNSVHRLNQIGVDDVQTIAVNTDAISLKNTNSPQRLLIGAECTRGLGAGGRPDLGESCAINAASLFDSLFHDVDLTFVIAGMGGGTGTGAAPVVAEAAHKSGSVVISIATMPFRAEGGRKHGTAMKGLRRLRENSDTLLILDNNRLLNIVGNIPFNQALGVMDRLIAELIRGLVDALTKPSLINLDFADLRSVILNGGVSTIIYGENADPEGVVRDAISNPLLEVDITGGTGALIHLSGGTNLSLRRAHRVFEGVTQHLDPDANIKFGVRVSEECEDTIRLLAVITGIGELTEQPIDDLEPTRNIGEMLVKYGR